MIRNAVALTLAEVLGRVIGLFVTLYLGRVLGVEQFGLLNFAFAIATYFTLPVNFGFADYGILHVAKNRDPDYVAAEVAQVLALRLAIAVASFVALIGMSSLVPALVEHRPIIIAASAVVLGHALGIEWLFTALERMTMIAVGRVIGAVFYALAIVLLIDATSNLTVVAGLWAGRESVVAALLLIVAGRRVVPIRLRIDPGAWRTTLQFAFPIGISTFVAQAHANIDLIIVGFLLDDEYLGWYAAALHLIGVALVVKRITAQLLLPRLASRAHEPEVLQRTVRALQRYATSGGLYLALSGSFLGARIVDLLYGVEYSGAALALQIGAWRVGVDLAGVVILTSVFVVNQKRFAVIFSAATALNVVLNLLLVPQFEIAGAAAAYVASTVVLLILAIREAKQIGFSVELRGSILDIGVAGAAMVGAFAVSASLGVIVQAGIGSVIFVLVLWLAGWRSAAIRNDFAVLAQAPLAVEP